MNNKIISVIVPVYNVEKYLKKCIDSIINQTYKNLEIILVDDGSPDRCGEICDEYTKKDNRIKVIHKENGGLSSARNVGIEIATGNYISFVDSDDYISENMMELLYMNIIKNDADISMCDFEFVNEDGSKCNIERQGIRNIKYIAGREILDKGLLAANEGFWVIACSKLYKRELFKNIRYPINKQNEDAFVTHKIYHACNRVSCICNRLYYYVQRNDSIMHSEYSIKKLDNIEAFIAEFNFFIQHNYSIVAINNIYPEYIRLVTEYYQKANLKDKKIRTRFKELHNAYRKIYKYLMKSNIGLIWKIEYTMNYINPYINCMLVKVMIRLKNLTSKDN